MKAIIVANGSFNLEVLKLVDLHNSFIIGVDGGCDFLIKNGIRIDFAIGDFDSIQDISVLGCKKIEKTDMDYSDLEIAAMYCLNKGFKEVIMLGCTGERSDHLLFNLNILHKLFLKHMDVRIIDEFNVIKVIEGENYIEKDDFKFFSITPIYDNTIITIKGAKYNLENKKLSMVDTLTLSNEWEKEKVFIKVDKVCFVFLVF